MKQPPSVTKLLQKVDAICSIIENLREFIREAKQQGLTVSFYHGPDRKFIGASWSDRFDNIKPDGAALEYTYKVTSSGIHFISFLEKDTAATWWSSKRYWYSSGESKDCSLSSVPNTGPDGYRSMYLFHQEKIRETLAALPAWAICVATDY